MLATAIYLEAKATDDALELFDVLMTNDLIARAQRQAKDETLKRYPRVTADAATCASAVEVMLASLDADADATVAALWASIESVVSRADLTAAVANIASVALPQASTPGGEWRAGIVDRYAIVRRFLPVLCRVVEFGATAGAGPILTALRELPRAMVARPTKRVPAGYLDASSVDLTIVPAGWWQTLVFAPGRPANTVDRAAYVFCVLEQFHQRLGRRDIYAVVSSRWADPRQHLLSGPDWAAARGPVLNALGLPSEPDELLGRNSRLLDTAWRHVAATEAVAVDDDGRIHTEKIDAIPDPPSLTELRTQCEAMLPLVDIGEAILEVMSWEPGFLEAFKSASGAPTRLDDLHTSIAAALTAHALNIGFTPVISPAAEALTRSRLSHVDQNYLRSDTYSAANASLITAQADIDLAQAWGGGLVAAVDGIRFVVPVRSIDARPNPKYFGRGRGATLLNLINDHAVGIAAMVVSGTPRDSLHLSNCQELWIEDLTSGGDVLLGGVGVGVGLVGGPFLEVAVDEDGPGSNERDEVWCVDAAPPVLGGVEELVGHRQRRLA